jgi:hypothetical protein
VIADLSFVAFEPFHSWTIGRDSQHLIPSTDCATDISAEVEVVSLSCFLTVSDKHLRRRQCKRNRTGLRLGS